MSDERQKKIETGKLKLAKFQRKNAKVKGSNKNSSACSSFELSSPKNDNDKSEATDSSSNASFNTMKDKSETSLETVMDSSLLEGGNITNPEEDSDDVDPLLTAKQAALLSGLQQKLLKYQDAVKQKDLMIHQLSQQLASSMNATEAADIEGSETVAKFKSEISALHLQLKEAAGMIKKQNSKSNGKDDFQVILSDQVPCVSDVGVQVENSDNINVQYVSLNSNLRTIASEEHVDCTVNKEQTKVPGDIATVLKKIDSLSVITKLIESVANISKQSINESSVFSPSKLQLLFLKRMNSAESEATQVDALENESQISDINYAEIESDSFARDMSQCHSVEKIRSHMVPNLSLVTDFLFEEMECVSSTLLSLRRGPQGDCDLPAMDEVESKSIAECDKSLNVLNFQDILQQKARLESDILRLKQLQNDLKDVSTEDKTVSNDNFANSDDNLIMDEPPLSCVSLLSLTDSEYRTEYPTTDSEANFSRKVSLDSSRPAHDRDFCQKCDKYFELVKDKYDDHLCLLKESVENNLCIEKNEIIKKLELEIERLKTDKDNMHDQTTKQIELLYQEHEQKIQLIINGHERQVAELQERQSKWTTDKDQLVLNIKELEKLLNDKNKELHDAWDEKANIEISLQKQIADLVEEHQEDLEARQLSITEQFSQERKKLGNEHLSIISAMKKLHEEELEELKTSHAKDLQDIELRLKNEFSNSMALIETCHSEECSTYQKRIEQLLEEKCELLNKTTQEYETILKKNHKVLVRLCNQLRSRICDKKKKIADESCQSLNSNLDASVVDALDVLNQSIEHGLLRFLDRNYFAAVDHQDDFDETQYLPIEMKPVSMNQSKDIAQFKKEKSQKVNAAVQSNEKGDADDLSSSISFDAEQMEMIRAKTLELQEAFQKDIAVYMEVNEKLRSDLLEQESQNEELKQQTKRLESQLLEKDKDLQEKESQLNSLDNGSLNDVAQTNSRLLHVLSDLVKTFLDIEQEINRHLYEHGLVPSRSGTLGHHDEETGHSVGSREDFASLSFGEGPNLELAEDGPDLTPRAWDVFSAAGTYDHEMEGEDVVLGASRRLRQAVDHVLNLLTRALDNQQNQDLKLLLKRNEELSQELSDETKMRDEVHMQLIAAEGTIRKLENEKQNLNDVVADFRENQDMLKREVTIERNKVAYLAQEKEAANDQIQVLKSQCELLASRLGDPEQMSTNKTLISEVNSVHVKSELLQENSKLNTEKHNVQINLSKERQSFLDKLQQMEMALEDLNAEKEEIMEKKCKEIRDLKAEMEAMEKQLHSNKKFIEEQAQEREQEREDYLKEINKMQETVREKEKIQSNEAQLMKEIDSLEQNIRSRIEDHQNAMRKKDAVENELRQSLDKIRDLRDVIEELEKQLNIKTKTETELRQKLSSLTETVNAHAIRNSALGDELALSKNVSAVIESGEHVQNLKERLASQSIQIEKMSQSETVLQELRGMIHFLEAKVEQRAKQLESAYMHENSPVMSSDTSPGSYHESELMHLPREDGWEMSPRSLNWHEVSRLEEKIGRLVHIDEELIKKIKELEQKLKKLQHIHTECELENGALQEKLSEQMMQVSALRSHMEEQKHRPVTPQKTQILSKKLEDLQELYEVVLEKNNQLFSELKEKSEIIHVLRDEVSSLQERIHTTTNEKEVLKKKLSEEDSSCYKLMILDKEEELKVRAELIENLQNQLKDHHSKTDSSLISPDVEKEILGRDKLIKSLEEENSRNKCEIEVLKKEITALKEMLDNSKQLLDSEQEQVEALVEQITSLTQDNKKLEEDMEVVQNMMQQKERELATLHEETDVQMKLEAELEDLESELERQKSIENDLTQRLKEAEAALDASGNVLKREKEQWKSLMDDLKTSHQLEIGTLKNQLDVFKQNAFINATEDVDLIALRNQILEATKAFKLENPSDSKDYAQLVYSLLKKAVDVKSLQLQKEHEVKLCDINESWKQKIQEESPNQTNLEKYKKKYLLMKGKLKEETNKLCTEKDIYWQSKIDELKSSLKGSYEEQYSKELNSLECTVKQLSKEKSLCENKAKNLALQVENFNENLKIQKQKIFEEFQYKLSAIEQRSKENHEAEFKKSEDRFKLKLEKAKQELEIALKHQKQKHQEEIAELQKLYEARWTNEVQKIMSSQMEELKKLNSNKETNLKVIYNQMSAEYSEKLQKIKEECIQRMVDERKHTDLQRKAELERTKFDLQKQFEEEKRSILITKEAELTALAEALKEKEFTMKSMSKNQTNSNWEDEKMRLLSQHKKEMSDLKQKLRSKYDKLLHSQSEAHDTDVKNMEQTYSQRLEEVSDLLRIAKHAATGGHLSDSGSNRTGSPCSAITSSDEACSSCREDMLTDNKHLLVDKLHQEGKRILNLVQASGASSDIEKKARVWLEERMWVIERLKNLNEDSVTNCSNLKFLVEDLCEEILNSRMLIGRSNQEINSLQKNISELEDKITDRNTKICILASNLDQQRRMNTEISTLLTSSSNEVSELKRTIEENRQVVQESSRSYSQHFITNSSSSSHDVGRLRSSDNHRSNEKFSMFLPQIESSPPVKLNKTSEESYPESVKSMLELTCELLKTPENIEPFETEAAYKSQSSSIHQQSAMLENEGLRSNFETKVNEPTNVLVKENIFFIEYIHVHFSGDPEF